MVAIDKRRNLIVDTANRFFNADETGETSSEASLESFLSEAKCRTLFINSVSRVLKFSNNLSLSKVNLVFFKTLETAITEENFHDVVQITSLSQNGVNDLIQSLRQVWFQILKDARVDVSILKKFENDLLGKKSGRTLVDEESYLRDKSNSSRNSEEKKNYDRAVLYVKNIRREGESALTSKDGLIGMEDALEVISGILDDLWKLRGPLYSEDRMRSLYEIIDNEITRLIQDFICQIQDDDRTKDEALKTAVSIAAKWSVSCERQTGLFWANQSSHQWTGKPVKPEKLSQLEMRLKELTEIRAQNRQLARLLTANEKSTLGLDTVFENFNNFQELLDIDSEIQWNRLKSKIHVSLAPAEERVASKLKTRMIEAKTPAALETEFRRYGELMKRESIARLLRAERQSFLATYPELIDSCTSEPDSEQLLDSPKILLHIQTARLAEIKLKSLRILGKELLSDLPGFNEISEKIQFALKNAESQRQELTESWVNETKSAIARKELTLSKNSAVVELTGTQLMRVNFDPRLTTLIREARGLSAEGLELPSEIRDLVEQASALTGRARALEQIANFHNTIGDRMIPSQRPLMLTTALELASAVREQSGVVWSDLRAIDAYTNRLKELVKRFGRQNAELASKHATLRDMVGNLLKGDAINLVTNQNVWKETLRSMKSIVDSVEASYGNTKAWKLHWDRQLLKALGIAYRAALPTLVKKMPEFRVELTYRDECLQWRPAFEDIRTKLYSGIRRFLAIPANFRGVGDQVDGRFQTVITNSTHLFGLVYREAEILLEAMEQFRKKWLPFIAPGKIDVSEKLKGKAPQEWERAFKDCKQWAQEISKLKASEIKISCMVIETGTIRSDLESLSRRHWEELANELRIEASSRLVSVVDFISSSTKKLSQRGHSIEEVSASFEAYNDIKSQAQEVYSQLDEITGLARILAAWTRERLEGINNARNAWESLKNRLDNYQDVMVHQLEEAKLNLRHQVLALHDDQERWNVKWAEKPDVVTQDWLDNMRDTWKQLLEQRTTLVTACQRFQFPTDEIGEVDEQTVARVEAELEAEELNCKFQNEFVEELKRYEDEEWLVARKRLPKFYDWLDSWESRFQLHISQPNSLTKELSSLETQSFMSRKIRELRKATEMMQILRSDDLADEHWQELFGILELSDVRRMGELTFGHLSNRISLINSNVERIKEITKRASAESGVRQALVELETWENYTSLSLQETKDNKNTTVYLVSDYSTLLARAGELRLILEGARGVSGFERFVSRISRSEASLYELEERIKVLSILQRKWIYLDPVYNSGAAPTDSGRWLKADKEFRFFMGEIAKDPKIPTLKNLPYHALSNLKELMDRCQKSLDDFLEDKRLQYPRLYFLSDEDLLELVSGKDKGLDVHLSKLYQGVGSVEKDKNQIISVISPEGEKLRLVERIDVTDMFPKWLQTLEDVIRNTLFQSLHKCLSETSPDVLAYPTQVLLLSERIRFTELCESAILNESDDLKSLLESLEAQRVRYRHLEETEDELTLLKVKNLLLETVHHLQVVRNLLDVYHEREKLAWTWSRQLRTYRQKEKIVVKCAEAEFLYRFEYQGASIGLVRTALTEKCYLALTQAMKLGLGGSPTGPAGTGKTESVKALGSILGRRVLVFNCDEGMDAHSMRRILSGLARAGAWGCFDEFNRLEEGTLSAVGMLIRPLQESIRDRTPNVVLDGFDVSVNPHCCLFITMNPASDDYGGRRKLPDSLARLFRPIGMARPNKTNIVRSLLECAGFSDASVLASQLVETFNAADKLLSKQPHYDWGLRALRSVLNTIPSASNSEGKVSEKARLISSMKTSTIPKLVEKDLIYFKNLLKDIFHCKEIDASINDDNKEKLRTILHSLRQTDHINEHIIDRCLQLNDQLQGRSGVAVVGPPGSGKSLIIRTLADALSKSGSTIKLFFIYPGAVTKSKLLGSVDSRTREFKDGLFSKIISANDSDKLWIVLNGDVEPEWAESLNSALDDNRILTLPNGVGIKLENSTRFIFETHKLAGASPATVSRLGIVYLGLPLIAQLLTPHLEEVSSIPRKILQSTIVGVIEQILKIKSDQKSADRMIKAAISLVKHAETETQTCFGILMSLCGQLQASSSRDSVTKYIFQTTGIRCPDPQHPFDVIYNENQDVLEPFTNTMQIQTTEDGAVCLTGSIQRGTSCLLPVIKQGQTIFVRGPSNSGKKSLLSVILTRLKIEYEESFVIIKQSALYDAQDLIGRLKRSCIKLDSSAGSRTYKAKNGSQLLLIIEDLHLASKSLQELIRQLIQDKGFYEDDLEFASFPLTIITTADTLTKIHPRLDSLMISHYLSYYSSREIETILELHIKEAFKNDDITVKAWTTKMTGTILEAFKSSSSDEERSKLTLRDLMIWINSLQHYPEFSNESDITNHLLDASDRLFKSKLALKQHRHLNGIINARMATSRETNDAVFVLKGKLDAGLNAITEKQWASEIDGAITRCKREGENIEATASGCLIEIATGISWSFGCGFRGILLPGRPGSGRKTATKLISTISSLHFINPAPGKGHSAIKTAVQTAAIDGEPTCLLLEEHHLRVENFAVLASAIVSRGELPGLYTSEELEGLVLPLSDSIMADEFSGTAEQYLYHRIKRYLRVVMIVDTFDMKEEWLQRSGLLRNCVKITGQNRGSEWWTMEEPLSKMAHLFVDPSEGIKDDALGIKELVEAHVKAPLQQQSPARFLSLLKKWKALRESWCREIAEQLKTLKGGIDRLKEAGGRVAKLEEDVAKQRLELEEEKGRANAALEKITATMRGATGQRGEMATLKAETEKESLEVARRKKDIEKELGNVEPLVEQAAQAVAGISADALAEVRSLRAPPAPVRDVLEGVLRLMGIQDTSWNSMKTFLAKRGIKDEIRNWDARRSTSNSLDAVEKLVRERAQSFEEKTAKRASIAAAPLAAWVLANLQYGKILQQVAPLEREQRVLSERLLAAEAQIGKLEAGLNTVEARVAQLQEELAAHSRSAAELQLRTEATESSLMTARTLLSKLDVEHKDWQDQYQILTERQSRIGIDAARAASILTYQDSSRNDDWRKRIIELLVTERDRLQWKAQGLPSDTDSFMGAMRVLKGALTPLFIDPTGVAVNWLKQNIGTQLEVTRVTDARFLTSIELAVRFGKPLLIEEILELPPILLPILRNRPLRLGDRSLPLQEGFRVFLATRQESLKTLPTEADAVLSRITLGTGTKSLTERLVEKAVLHESPEVEERRRQALEHEEKLYGEREAARLELLTKLGAARSQDILQESQEPEGGGLLGTLELTQSKAKEIATAIEQSRQNLEDISKKSREHERLAKFTAIFYKSVKSLAHMNTLYTFTVDAITELFLEAEKTRRSLGSLSRDEREKALEKTVITLILQHCMNAVYRKHRLALALHLALSQSRVPDEQKNHLMTGDNFQIKRTSDLEHNIPNFVPEERRSAVRALLDKAPEVVQKIQSTWINNVANILSYDGVADGAAESKSITSFEKILLVQALHPEYLHSALSKWSAEQLGVRSLTPPSWTLKQIAEESRAVAVLLLLSPGGDPAPELNALVANQLVTAPRFVEVSLGQGHTSQAELALETACRDGGWILLSNLQLALNWLPRLDSLLRSPSCTSQRNSGTRIWLSSEECSGFYPGLAGLCLKLAYEPPEGVKRNVKRSVQQLSQRQPALRDSGRLLLVSWLHAVLQERRKFVPQGWVKAYAWSEAELEAACELVVRKSNRNGGAPGPRAPSASVGGSGSGSDAWESERGILEAAVYGGLLQDEYDTRVLRVLLRDIWSRDVYQGKRKLGGVLSLPRAAPSPLLALDKLDDGDSPQNYFGLPANAQRAWEKSAAETSLGHLKHIHRKSAGSSKDSAEERSSAARVTAELKTLIEQQKLDSKGSRSVDDEDPLRKFLHEEISATKQLLRTAQSYLETSKPTTDLRTPAKWLTEWPSGPRELVPFVSRLVSRYQSLQSMNGSAKLIELSWFCRPDAFVSAFKLFTARRANRPYESLRLRAKWDEDVGSSEEWKTSITVTGLLLTGAKIERGVLEEVAATASSVAAAPDCRITFIDDQRFTGYGSSKGDGGRGEADTGREQNSLQIPVYSDASKSHLVCSLPVRYHDEQREVWLQRGISFHLRAS